MSNPDTMPMTEAAKAREEFYENCWTLIRYWSGEIGNVPESMPVKERVSGVVFSILVSLDGCGGLDSSHSLVRDMDGLDLCEGGRIHLHDGLHPERPDIVPPAPRVGEPQDPTDKRPKRPAKEES